MGHIIIPKYNLKKGTEKEQAPCWKPLKKYGSGEFVKPIIVCDCGMEYGLRLHWISEQGEINPSFYHKHIGGAYANDNKGCGWHVWLQLEDYNCGEFKAGKR